MNMRDLFRLTLSNLNRMRGRAIMTAMGVVIGTSSIVVLIALAAGLQANTTSSFSDFGAVNQITVLPGAAVQTFGGDGGNDPFDENARLTPDVLRQFESIPGVDVVTPIVSVYASTTLKLNRLVGNSSLTGVDPRAAEPMGFEVAEGTDRLGNWTIVVGARVSENFVDPRTFSTPDELPDLYGQTISLQLERTSTEGELEKRTLRLRVGGVLEEVGGQQDNMIYMSLDDAEELNTWALGTRPDRRRDGYDQAIVVVEDLEQTMDIEAQILDQGFYAFSAQSIIQQLNIFFVIVQAIFGGIGAIALLVAAIGITNTMIMSILERTREIGLMKAVGATNRDVMSVFIVEAGAIGLLGGIGGAALGSAIAKIIDLIAGAYISAQTAASGSTSDDPISIVVIPPLLLLFSILFSLFIGVVSGIYPALRAVQLDPVAALKYE
jgi:putative ABC transport system permease protein